MPYNIQHERISEETVDARRATAPQATLLLKKRGRVAGNVSRSNYECDP